MSAKRRSKVAARQADVPAASFAGGEMAIMSLDPLDRKFLQLPAFVEKCVSSISSIWKWAQSRSKAQSRRRKLRVCESAQLGDKRFIALVQADGQRFLIGGTATSIALLATLPKRKSFRSLMPDDTGAEAREQ